jgi:hypothetical protein
MAFLLVCTELEESMIDNYKAPEDKQWKYIFFAICAAYTIMVGWAFYDFGYNEAKWTYSQPVKYRCHEGIMYRSIEGMWQKTSTECKKLEEIK